MPKQVAVTPLALAVLELLQEKPMHPYEMHQTMRLRHTDRVVKIKAGSLYHTVDRLGRLGLIEVAETSREGRRPERTLFRITDAGHAIYRERVTDMLATTATEYPEFALALALGDDLERDVVLDRLRLRLDELEQSEALERGEVEQLEQLNLPKRYWLDVRYSLAMREAEHTFVTRLIHEIESGELDWEETK